MRYHFGTYTAQPVFLSRASPATYIDAGVLKYAGVDEARYQDGILLIEDVSTNHLNYSGDITNWSVTGGVTAPTPDHLVTSTNAEPQVVQHKQIGNIPLGTKLAISVIVEKDLYDRFLLQIRNAYTAGWQQIIYEFSTNTFVATSPAYQSSQARVLANNRVLLTYLTDEVERDDVNVIFAMCGSDINNINFTGNGVNGVFIYEAQVEYADVTTSIIVTEDVPEDRAKDIVTY